MSRRGRFISIEGVEGVGKTTASDLLYQRLVASGQTVVRTREPGGTPLAESIRALVLGDGHAEPVTATTELLLMFAARAQSVAGVIRPALERGDWVLCDRYTDATLAYQGYGRGMPLARIRTLAEWVHGDLWPDVTLLLTAPADVLEQRLQARAGGPDRIEQESRAFFERADAGYRAMAADEPGRFRILDTDGGLDALGRRLDRLVDEWLTTPLGAG